MPEPISQIQKKITDSCRVAFMPYAPVKEKFKIGDYEIWPYYKEKNNMIKDKMVLKYLDRFFSRYFEPKYSSTAKRCYDKRLESITIISPFDFPVGVRLSEKQESEINSIAHIIAFCAVTEGSFFFTSSDAFILHFITFGKQKPISVGIYLYSTYYHDINMIKIMKPYYILDPLSSSVGFAGTDLARALGNALQYNKKPEIKRLFRTLELFYYTTTRAEMITAEHKLLTLVMGFEILLDLENKPNKKLALAKEITSQIVNYKPVYRVRPLRNETCQFSQTAWWAYDIYDLRNKIVHGAEIDWQVEKYGDILARIEFGGLLLRKLIKNILTAEKLWQSDTWDKILEADSLDEELKKIVNNSKDEAELIR